MRFEMETERVFALDENGRLIAETTFPIGVDGVADINHTFVDESLRGQGIATRLLQAAADQLRAQGKKTRTTCSYAAAWFERHPEEQDLLAEP